MNQPGLLLRIGLIRVDADGILEHQQEGTPNPLRYMAREIDAATGLYYVRARWYDPSLERFVSEDPTGLVGGINPYAYVGDDPVNHTDPSGLDRCRAVGRYARQCRPGRFAKQSKC